MRNSLSKSYDFFFQTILILFKKFISEIIFEIQINFEYISEDKSIAKYKQQTIQKTRIVSFIHERLINHIIFFFIFHFD